MSCRHNLANGTCIRCYPSNPYGRSARDLVDPGPEESYEPNLEGPGAMTASVLREKEHVMQTPLDPPQLTGLVEQLRNACLAALDDLDLVVRGMLPGEATRQLLEAALVEAAKYLKQAKAVAPHPHQNENKVIRNGKVAVLYASGYGWGWHTHNDNPDGSMLFDPEMVAAVEAGAGYTAIVAIAKRKWPAATIPPLLRIAWVPQGARFQLNVHEGAEDVQILSAEGGWLA